MNNIITLSEIKGPHKEQTLRSIEEIFFLSSSIKEFSSPERKFSFFKRWCRDYIELFPDEFLVMKNDSDEVLGYLSGCLDSSAAQSSLEVPAYSLFKDLFSEFPAHFHINFHPQCRGMGLGSVLLNDYCQRLKDLKIKGVHLITSPDSANVTFYQRLNFKFELEREFNERALLFMGKVLE